MNKKLSGFTLIELLFALALTGLVLVMGSGTFRVFVSFFHRFDQQTDRSYEAMIFKDRLAKDFDAASFLEINQKGSSNTELILLSLQGEIRFGYEFQGSLVIRKDASASIDTFHIKTLLNPFPSGRGISLIDTELELEYVFQLKKRAKANPEEYLMLQRK